MPAYLRCEYSCNYLCYPERDSYRCPFISLPYKTCSWFPQGTTPGLHKLGFNSHFQLFLSSNSSTYRHIIAPFGAIASHRIEFFCSLKP